MSTKLMVWLILNYATVAAVSIYERNYARDLYWFEAALITTSVIWMGK